MPVPPKTVADEAKKGLKYREMAGGKGGLTPSQAKAEGIGSGVQRAVNLKNRDNLSIDTIKRMKAFFDRHQKNKAISPEHKNEPWKDKGYVAWLLWGGDAGYVWAKKELKKMEKKASVADYLRLLVSRLEPKAIKTAGWLPKTGDTVSFKPGTKPIYSRSQGCPPDEDLKKGIWIVGKVWDTGDEEFGTRMIANSRDGKWEVNTKVSDAIILPEHNASKSKMTAQQAIDFFEKTLSMVPDKMEKAKEAIKALKDYIHFAEGRM